MSLDRAIILPHEFDKKDDNPPANDPGVGAVEVLRSPTKSSGNEPGEHARVETIEKP